MDKITIERETLNAAMMALEYLLEASPVMTTKHRDAYSTAARLRAALAAQPAEAKQEPVTPTLPPWWFEFIVAVCELPDRNSPEGEPDAMVATEDELASCALAAIERTPPDECVAALKSRLQAIGDLAASCRTGPGLREAMKEIECIAAAQPAEPTMDTALRNATRRSAAVIHPGRLAAQPAEPVAWRWKERVNGMSDSDWTVTNVEPPDGVRVIAKEPLYAAQPAPAAVPPGYALVPIEPTHGMLSALTQEWHPSKHGPMKQRYRAMIAAAGDNT